MKIITDRLGVISSILLIAAGFVGGVVIFGGFGDNVVRAVGLGPADLTVAESDEEWLRLIDEARERRASPDVVFPDPRLGNDVVSVDACGALPPNAAQSEMMAELSTNEAVHRVIVLFADRESGARYALFLRSDREYPDCSEELQQLAAERPNIFSAVDAHVCEEMERMAKGEESDDVTLRQASPTVARAYLDTFCYGE